MCRLSEFRSSDRKHLIDTLVNALIAAVHARERALQSKTGRLEPPDPRSAKRRVDDERPIRMRRHARGDEQASGGLVARDERSHLFERIAMPSEQIAVDVAVADRPRI